jgi:Tol biopolymer transport system component
LLVSGPVAQEKQAIWMISVIGATLKKLRDDAHQADLSPDGSQIVFLDAISHELWIMNADGGQARLLLKPEPGYHLFAPTWFAGGKRIAYVRYRVANGETTIVLESRDVKGEDPVALLSNPRLSDFFLGQNGRLIYAVSEPQPNQYDSNLWELWFDPQTGSPKGTSRRLTDWTGFYFVDPELTADEKRFVFLDRKGQSDVYIAELTNGGTELKTPQRLTLDERLDWPGGWSLDGKTVFLYSDRNGSFDIYKQGVDERNADTIVSGPEEKWAPQITPDGKWVLYMQWPKGGTDPAAASGKLMRVPLSGGPPEVVMDIKGRPDSSSSSSPQDTVGGYPSFRCPTHASTSCVLAEGEDNGKQIVFSSFDPAQGRKAELVKIPSNPDLTGWDLSPDGSRVAISVFDYKAADVRIIPLAGGPPQKFSVMPWTELAAVAWAADGKSLFLASYSSRGTSIVRSDLGGATKLMLKSSWDIFSLDPSPDGHYLGFGPVIYNANAWTIPSFPEK